MTNLNNLYMTKDDAYLFHEGTWAGLYEKLGAHPASVNGQDGYSFGVWAPKVKAVSVVGDFNNWDEKAHPMTSVDGEIWELFIPGAKEYDNYKFAVTDKTGETKLKCDPIAFHAATPPETASKLYDIDGYEWHDKAWMDKRAKSNHMEKPLNIYEVNFGSWKRYDDGNFYSYRDLAESLVPYAVDMGYTHIEIMPLMEHPFGGSWGYQITGYYAPTSRYGTPKDLMYFVDCAHKAGLGVILDWVPGHFCPDAHGLVAFNGEKLYEKEQHPQWGTYKFDFRRGEVRSFMKSNAFYWIERYHADGIRVDGVTSMLYLNFGVDDDRLKKFNEKGTEEDLDNVKFIQILNKEIGAHHPDVMMIAEESTAWPLVTYPPEDGGLGFNYKWDMGWMHDTLHYMQADFPYRPGAHHLLTFSMMYTFNENFILALSHDEVVHGKCSLIGRMPGDYWRQFAGMRALAFYQIAHPGAKLNFMGAEIAEFIEWRYYEGLEWFLPREHEAHRKHQAYIKALNHLYKTEKALYEQGYSWDGFEWLDADNSKQSMISFIRRGKQTKDEIVILINFCPETYQDFRLGVPRPGTYKEIFNSNAPEFGGSGTDMNPVPLKSEKIPFHGQKQSIAISVPPIGGVMFKRTSPVKKEK